MASPNSPFCSSARLRAMFRPRPLPSVVRLESPPHEPLHQFVRRNIQLLAADVLDPQPGPTLPLFGLHVNSGARLGVFAGVAQQVIHHPPGKTPVQHRPDRFTGQLQNRFQVCFFPAGGRTPLPPGVSSSARSVGLGVHRQASAAGLAGLHQILGEFFQSLSLPGNDRRILGGLGFQRLFLQQIHIVDDAGKGCFQIVGTRW